MKVVFLFIDGLGIAPENSATNPCTYDDTGILRIFTDKKDNNRPFAGISLGLDAALGVEGRPQSASGQTTLLTGINAPQLLGKHLTGFPNKALRQVLLRHSILLQVKKTGKLPAFINAFRPMFFTLPEETILRLSATTIANYAAGLPFFTIKDVIHKRAIYQDFTNIELLERGFEIPIYSPEEAADILAGVLQHYDFILYEYFKTDKAAHSRDMSLAVEEIQKLGHFIHRFLSRVDLTSTVVILTSDHGNIEDMTSKSHTTNPAMTIVWGTGNDRIAKELQTIQHITPMILQILNHGIDK